VTASHLQSAARALELIMAARQPQYVWTATVRDDNLTDGQSAPTALVGAGQHTSAKSQDRGSDVDADSAAASAGARLEHPFTQAA
jgi:hypothetical protein